MADTETGRSDRPGDIEKFDRLETEMAEMRSFLSFLGQQLVTQFAHQPAPFVGGGTSPPHTR